METIKLDIDGSRVDALLGLPAGSGPCPGILIAHHQEGLSPFTRDLAAKLTQLGYAVICPDNYHRCRPEDDLAARRNSIIDSVVTREFGVALNFLKQHPRVRPDRLAIVGHCMGGRTALLAASAFKEIMAAVIFYPTALYVKRTGGTMAFDDLGGIACPVIAFFGDTDRLIPPEHADRFEAALLGRHVPLEMHRYPDAGHAFCNFTSAADYREGPAADSWRHATAFLERHLCP